MHIKQTALFYTHDQTSLEGFVAYPIEKKRPVVILCHAWRGRDPFICEQAVKMAEWGYVGFALDMYGKGILGQSKEENASLKRPFIENRALLQARVLQGYKTACQLPDIDPSRIVVIGYGFGGLCALDLARAGVPLKGAVSFYGHFNPPPQAICNKIEAKILILHGYKDPLTPQEELHAFEKVLTAQGVDWQAHIFGGAMHAFATPGAHDPASGILYDPVAASRAQHALHAFLQELFPK